MPLSPRRQSERRAELKEQELKRDGPPTIRYFHCRNCGKRKPKTHYQKKFCDRHCKDEFHRHGSAFGPLKETLHNLVKRWLEENATEKQRQLRALEARIEKLEMEYFHSVQREVN